MTVYTPKATFSCTLTLSMTCRPACVAAKSVFSRLFCTVSIVFWTVAFASYSSIGSSLRCSWFVLFIIDCITFSAETSILCVSFRWGASSCSSVFCFTDRNSGMVSWATNGTLAGPLSMMFFFLEFFLVRDMWTRCSCSVRRKFGVVLKKIALQHILCTIFLPWVWVIDLCKTRTFPQKLLAISSSSQQSATSNQQPTTGNRQPATRNRQLATTTAQ